MTNHRLAHRMHYSIILLWMGVIGIPLTHGQGRSGEVKWLRVNSLHAFVSEQGTEVETGGLNIIDDAVSWPAEYGLKQSTLRAKAMMLGCKDYFDSRVNVNYSYKVVGIGPRLDPDWTNQIFPASLKLVGKFEHPVVVVDGNLASENNLYDALDEIDETLPADRMVEVTVHSAIGVSVRRRVYAFTQQNHNNYLVYDYMLKNTGIINGQGTVYTQPVKDLMFYLQYRYALSGESVLSQQDGWGTWDSTWGKNVVNQVVGTDPTAAGFRFRALYAWYGTHSQRVVADDWGCPNQNDDGILSAAKYVGCVTLHADQSPQNPADNPYQPITTSYIGSDNRLMQIPMSQFDEVFMTQRYQAMTAGHDAKTHAEEVGSGFANLYGTDPGGYSSSQGFGPYTLNPGDSVHIVMAEGVSGISRQKNREVGANWLAWWKGTGNPELIMPDGSKTTDYFAYKRKWVQTCEDSLLKTFDFAVQNYQSGYSINQPPPAPQEFTVNSGGDRIQLSWANNATTDPYFGGYIIYRSEGNVLDPKTVYTKLFECGKANVVHQYDDISAKRGFNYYYYIQSKDDGTRNTAQPGVPLVSSLFWTLTNQPAYLRRAAGTSLQQVRVVPNPYDIRSRSLQFGEDFQYDRIAFYGLPPQCKVKVYTERGDLVWEKEHTNGAGDELWDSLTSSGQIVVSGVYILYVEAIQTTGDIKAGDSVYRKFVIIR